MPLTCRIRCELDSFKRDLLRAYVEERGHVVPRRGGHRAGSDYSGANAA
jgi:hypothetical protein